MSDFQFDSSSAENEVHKCKSYRDGDWIIYYCPQCSDYERRINWRTGKMKSRHIKKNINHVGSHEISEYKEVFENLN